MSQLNKFLPQNILWKELATEFLGTFFLVLVGGSVVASKSESFLSTALAFGLTMVVLFYVWNQFSGTHLNPAVTLGFTLTKRMSWWLLLGYWIFQILGAIAASALIFYFYGNSGTPVGKDTQKDSGKAFLIEAFFSGLFVLVFLFTTANSFLAIVSGLVIGFTLAAATLAAMPATGASFNPARSFGATIFDSSQWKNIWIYIVAPLTGAIVAALIYWLFSNKWNCKNKLDDCGEQVLNSCGNKVKTCTDNKVDECGKVVMKDGKPEKITYDCVEEAMDQKQRNLWTQINQSLDSQGRSLKHFSQENNVPKEIMPTNKVQFPTFPASE